MKGLSILFTILLLLFAAALGQFLRQTGALPAQVSAPGKTAPAERSTGNLVNYNSNASTVLN